MSNFKINIFALKAEISDSEFPQDSKYVICFNLRYVELPNIASHKINVIVFALYVAVKKAKNRNFLKAAFAYSTCSPLTHCTFYEFHKILDILTILLKSRFLHFEYL